MLVGNAEVLDEDVVRVDSVAVVGVLNAEVSAFLVVLGGNVEVFDVDVLVSSLDVVGMLKDVLD